MPTVIPFNTIKAVPYLEEVRKKRPLIHCITNDVVQNFTANILLAVGAVPAMVIAKEEVSGFTTISDGLLVNIGTVHVELAKSMLLAAKTAMNTNTPWILDPVAVSSALPYRTDLAIKLLTFKPTIIRGNAAEILTLCGEKSESKGPDSQSSTTSAIDYAKALAKETNAIVALTGEIDYITNGENTYSITGGSIALTRITGVGCALSAMIAAFVASSPDKLLTTTSACAIMKKAGELANNKQGLGSFAVSLIDQLSLTPLR